jgi:hypothetical protein
MPALFFAFLLCGLAGCDDAYRYAVSGEVGWALKKELRDKHSNEVAIAKLTRFEWDELFLFGPYQPTSEACNRLAMSQADCASSIKSESTDDGQMLMVFRRNGKVVHSEMHIRWHGDFTPVPDALLTPASAIFTVSVQGKGAGGEDWLKLRLKPANQSLTGPSSRPSKAALLPSAEFDVGRHKLDPLASEASQ